MDFIELNFEKICRACKCEQPEMYSMFSDDIFVNQSEKIYEMFMACTSLHVSHNDGMPKMICSTCIEQLNIAFNFKKQCVDTDSYLRQYTQKYGIKIEGPNIKISFDIENNCEVDEADIEEKVKQESENTNENDLIPDTVFDCKFCEKKFINLSSLRLHIKKNHHFSDTKCRLCLAEFENSVMLKQHIQNNHANKTYICKICKKDKFAFSHLKRHMMSHLKHKPHACSVCNRRFLRSDHLSAHQKNCKGLKTFVCDFCNKGFTREDSLQCHIEMHNVKENLKILDSVENFLDHYIELDNDNETTSEDVEMSSLFHSPKSDTEFLPDNNDDDFESSIDNTLSDFKDIDSLVYKAEIKDEENEYTREMENNTQNYEKSGNVSDENEKTSEKESEPVKNNEMAVKRKRGRPRKYGRDQKVDKYPCTHCDKVLKTKLGYDIHMKKHVGGNVFNCVKCYKKFAEERHLLLHLETHSNDDIKEEVQESQQCDLCSEVLTTVDELVKHKLKVHNVKMKISNDKKYICYVCSKSFSTEKYRDSHEKTHSVEKMCTCKTCGKRFTTKANLNEHMKFHNECSKKFLCSECGQRFIRYDYLVIHMRRHRGEKPFKCRYCGKGFPRTTDLTVHERYHTGEKTHLCVICGRGFGRAYNLTVHMRTHTGEKPYQCTYCDAAFAQGNDLKAHVRRHTGERYYCDICSEPFLMGYLLTQHKRTVHGLDVKSHIRRLKPSERVNLPNSSKEQNNVQSTIVPSDNQTSSAQLQLAHALQDTTVLDITNELTIQNHEIINEDLVANQIKSEVIMDNLTDQIKPEITDAVT